MDPNSSVTPTTAMVAVIRSLLSMAFTVFMIPTELATVFLEFYNLS